MGSTDMWKSNMEEFGLQWDSRLDFIKFAGFLIILIRVSAVLCIGQYFIKENILCNHPFVYLKMQPYSCSCSRALFSEQIAAVNLSGNLPQPLHIICGIFHSESCPTQAPTLTLKGEGDRICSRTSIRYKYQNNLPLRDCPLILFVTVFFGALLRSIG